MQYVFWAFGVATLWRSHWVTRAGLAAEGVTIDTLAEAIARRWRGRHARRGPTVISLDDSSDLAAVAIVLGPSGLRAVWSGWRNR